MRLGRLPSWQVLLTASTILRPVAASWIPELFQHFDVLSKLEKRCANPCGYYGQLCCAAGQVCFTDSNGEAQCGAAGGSTVAAGGSWQFYTTTYVMTDLQTITTTFSSYIPAQTTQVATVAGCSYSQGETPCGNQCCLSGQYCSGNGICLAVPGGSSGYYSSLYTITTIVTNTASAPSRPTTQTIQTISSTVSGVTGTTSFSSPVSTGGSVVSGQQMSSGLSGGAIAGIVIGVIAGILILLTICLCCCFKGLLDGVLAIFGLGPRRRRRTEETIIEERHSRHSGGVAGRRTWFGTRPRRDTTTEVIEEKRKGGFFSNIGPMGWAAATLGGLALILGLKRRRDRNENVSEAGYTGSSYDYYDYDSASSPSSVTRSRSRSRASRGTRR